MSGISFVYVPPPDKLCPLCGKVIPAFVDRWVIGDEKFECCLQCYCNGMIWAIKQARAQVTTDQE